MKFDRTLGIIAYAVLLCTLLGVQCGSPTSSPSTTAKPSPATTTNSTANKNGTDYEYGIILTTYARFEERFAQLRHLPVMPYYQNYSGPVPGVGFTNRYIQFLSVDVDYWSKQIYLYDYYLRSVAVCYNYHMDLVAADLEFEFMHMGVSKGTIQVAVDWITHTVYWTDSLQKWVVAAPGQRDKIQLDLHKILFVAKHAPEGISLDPLKGLMFVSYARPGAKIEVSTMTGANRNTIVSSGLHSPTALEADIFDERIYWIDNWYETIRSVKYDGSDQRRTKLIAQSSLFDLAIYRDILAVSDIKNGNLYFMNKTTGNKRATTVNILPEKIYGLAMYNKETQPMRKGEEESPCIALKCEHLCLLNGPTATCVCSENYEYDEKNKTCVESPYLKALVVANRTHICLMDIRSVARQSYAEKCVFTVVQHNRPPPTTPVVRRKRQAPSTASSGKLSTTPKPTSTQKLNTTVGVTTTPKPNTTTPSPTTTTPPPTAAPGDMIKMIVLNVENRVIYYVSANNIIYARGVDLPLDNPEKERITASAGGTISGLVFDWLQGENLYWCESDTGQFHTVNEANRSPRRVSTSSYVGARDLVLLAHEKRLAWIQNYDEIHSMDLSGENHKVVLSGVATAKYLVYEPHEKNLYWMNTDEDEVYSVSFDGTKSKFMHYTQTDAAHLTLHQNYIMWTYMSSGLEYLITYERGTTARISLGYFNQYTEVMDMKVLDKSSQPMETDPCRYENGNCEQICITRLVNGVPKPECVCSLGFTLAVDGKGCESTLSNAVDFIMVTDWSNDAVYYINLVNNDIQAFVSADPGTYLGILYNPKDSMFYFGLTYSDVMYKSKLSGEEKEVFLDLVWADVENMALDEYSGNIYYTTTLWSYIGMVTPKGDEVELIDFGFDTLGAIAIHPGKGWLYYAVTEGDDYPYIARANMDGTKSTELIKGDDVQHPYGLAIDYLGGDLYWSDTITNVIQKCDLDGLNCGRFLRDYDANITDIVTDGVFLYYSSLNRHHVTKVKLDNSSVVTQLGSNTELGRLTHLSLYKRDNKNVQPVNAACKDNNGLGDCSTICLPTSMSRRCACDYGTDIKEDDETVCEDIYQCDDSIYQINDGSEIRFAPGCKRLFGDQCTYLCPISSTYADKSATVLECTNDGWTRESDVLCIEIRCPLKIPNGNWTLPCDRMSGEKCTYTCNSGFNPTKNFAVCTNDGTWDEDLDTLCAGNQCSAQVSNGVLDLDCEAKPGSQPCGYSCNKGYKKDPAKPTLTCLPSFQWNADTKTICKEVGCPMTIANGQITTCPSYFPGTKCDYKCNTGFTKPPGVSKMTCLNTEEWDSHGHSPCIGVCTNMQFTCGDGSCIRIEKKCDGKEECADGSDESQATCPPQCPNNYSNGDLGSDCSRFVGSVCSLTCKTGFALSSGIDNVACSLQKTWVPGDVCQAITCPASIQTGMINTTTCGRNVNSLCSYSCPIGYDMNSTVTSLKCLPTGQWNQTFNLCTVKQVVVVPEEQTKNNIGVGVGLGVGIFALILIILAVVGYLFYRRRKAYKEAPYAMTFDSNSSNVAIENPGYMQSQATSNLDDDYATVNTNQMQPAKFVGEDDIPADHGMVNPMFMEKHGEALPEVSQVNLQSDNHTNTLSYHDWKKRQDEA